jgi:biotin transport system permease protein
VHRARAGAKLLALLAVGAGSVFLDRPWQVAAAIGAVLATYLVAGLSLGVALGQVKPLAWVLGFLALFHVVVSGWERASEVVGVIVMLVLLAGLITLTTRTSAMVEAIVFAAQPLRKLGVEPERLGLLLALAIRSVPVIAGLAAEVRDAQRARGLTASPRAFAVPLIVRSLRHADALGDALIARGVDD